MWTQFMNIQGPMMQGMMNNYIDQSKNLFLQMQEQMQNQSKACSGRSRSLRPLSSLAGRRRTARQPECRCVSPVDLLAARDDAGRSA
jgi:hypothetical protein